MESITFPSLVGFVCFCFCFRFCADGELEVVMLQGSQLFIVRRLCHIFLEIKIEENSGQGESRDGGDNRDRYEVGGWGGGG